jgi:PAT family beta-lactamase induction signal transducer AmpG
MMTPTMQDDNPPRLSAPPPWLFGITGMPYGICAGFVASTMPFFTRKAGISVENIGWYGAALYIPSALAFLYTPLVDIGPKRKHWLILVSILSASCLCMALTMPLPSHIGSYLGLVFAASILAGLISSCNGGLIATSMPDEKRGATAGWLNLGNLTGGALGAWLTLSLAERCRPLTVGLALAAMMILPSLAVLAIAEPSHPRRRVAEVFLSLWRDVARVARSRPGWSGMLFCISPVGTAALLNYFSALAVDYHASDAMAGFVNGPVNGLVTGAGSLIGGYACDRVNRRAMYLLSGFLTAVCGVSMMLAPLTPPTYAVGVSAYLFVAGFCYASFSAVVLDAIGTGGAAASTQYQLFVSAGNTAIAYVGLVDTRFHHWRGARGLLGVDAALNIIGIAALATLFRFVRKDEAHAAR